MDDGRLGRTIRVLRQRRGWRQHDLGERCGLSRSAISDIERGRMDRYTLASLRRLLRALDADGELSVRWGAPGDLDRLLDRDHAALVRRWAETHRRHGWEVWPEASYSVYGERGRIDLLAFHPAIGILEVAEMTPGSGISRRRSGDWTPRFAWRPVSRPSADGTFGSLSGRW